MPAVLRSSVGSLYIFVSTFQFQLSSFLSPCDMLEWAADGFTVQRFACLHERKAAAPLILLLFWLRSIGHGSFDPVAARGMWNLLPQPAGPKFLNVSTGFPGKNSQLS